MVFGTLVPAWGTGRDVCVCYTKVKITGAGYIVDCLVPMVLPGFTPITQCCRRARQRHPLCLCCSCRCAGRRVMSNPRLVWPTPPCHSGSPSPSCRSPFPPNQRFTFKIKISNRAYLTILGGSTENTRATVKTFKS